MVGLHVRVAAGPEDAVLGSEGESVVVGAGQSFAVGWMVYYISSQDVLMAKRTSNLDTHIAIGDGLAAASCGEEGYCYTITVTVVGVGAGCLVGIFDRTGVQSVRED